MNFLKGYTFRKWHIVIALLIIIVLYLLISRIPFGTYVFTPDPLPDAKGTYAYDIPLDPESPWPKFRNNAPQNGRSQVAPEVNPALRPWEFKTGKGIFSSAVVDAEGTVYIGSADQYFYALRKDGSLKWKFKTGEVIDSSALLDDQGRVYFGSGDAHVYCLDRETGKEIWRFKADPVEVVEKKYDIKSYNVDWFEGNIAMLKDGTIIAPNDNFLIYAIDRETGTKKQEYLGNELMWSLPAVNTKTNRMFAGSQYMALENVFCYDTEKREEVWTSGGLGSNASSPLLTSTSEKGAVILGGYDGYVRAYAQDSGKQLWKQGTRGHIYSSPAQLSDGTVIIPSADGTIYALKPDNGKVLWAYDTLGPVRSSPAVDSKDRIYVGNGAGRLFCLNPDGTLRWGYQCILTDRNDLNGSPGLGKTGVYIAGQSGGIFFVPYDYPLSDAGRKDPRSIQGPGEPLPKEGDFLLFTENFGGLPLAPPDSIKANQPLCFTLFVRKNGDTVKTLIDRDSLKFDITGDPKYRVDVSANRQFFIITPQETWIGPEGGTMTFTVKGNYRKDPRRFGLKFFWGKKGDGFEKTYTFAIPARAGASPYKVPKKPGDPSTMIEFSRFAAPNPTMLPSWNQIGFDSLHYLAGAVEGSPDTMLFWVISGKLFNGETVVDPTMEMRFPLTLDYDRGLLTFNNYDGFKINFVGSWDMPFGIYRLSTHGNPATGAILESPALMAVMLCDEIEYYGKFLKLMGMSEFDTGHMAAFGGLNAELYGKGYAVMPRNVGSAEFLGTETSATVKISGGRLRKDDHVFSLLLVDAKTGRSFPLYYTKKTEVQTNAAGFVTRITVSYKKGEVSGRVRAYYMVDTYPAAKGEFSL